MTDNPVHSMTGDEISTMIKDIVDKDNLAPKTYFFECDEATVIKLSRTGDVEMLFEKPPLYISDDKKAYGLIHGVALVMGYPLPKLTRISNRVEPILPFDEVE